MSKYPGNILTDNAPVYNPVSGGGTPGLWSLNDAAYAAQNQSWNMYDPYWKNTTLLLNGEGAANAAQNNTFLDSSTNNFTITRNGNTTQGTFSPYGNLWSNYFDGNGDYLNTVDSASFAYGTGDCTVECWLFPTSAPSYQVIIDQRESSPSGGGFSIEYGSNLIPYLATSVVFLSGTIAMQLNAWNHVVYVRSGTTLSLFVNGVRSNTASNSTNLTSQRLTIGAYTSRASAYSFGYISNVRLVKGTAVYDPTAPTLTVPTAPLTAVSGTSLLTCQSNRFIDNSSNNFTLTVNGNTSVQRFSPFNPTAPYSASTIGGSGYFDGSGDYLIVGGGSSNAYNFGTGNATVEAWINTTAALGVIASNYDSGSGTVTDAWRLLIGQGTSGRAEWSQGSTIVAFNPKLVNDGAWHHVAAVINGGSVTIYVDGIGGTSVSLSGYNYTKTTDMYVGAYYAAGLPIQIPFTGYISNLRINKGNAVYTTNFTPPTAPVTAISGTTALLNFTNAGIPDAAMMNDLETVGNAQVSTSVKKYGTGSLAFDGTGDYLKLPANAFWNFSSGDWTIEGWLYPSNVSGGKILVENTTNGEGGLSIQMNGAAFLVYINSTAINAGTFTASTWQHFALVRSGSTMTAYINGSSVGTSSTTPGSGATGLWIGARADGSTGYNGYIDDLRITKGIARYTANFTPPTSSLQNL